MDMTNLENDIEFLAKEELKKANEKYSPFNSRHEAYAVLKEEIEEAEEEKESVDSYLDDLWIDIKHDFSKMQTKVDAELAKGSLVKQAAETIQAIAMCEKFLNFLDSEKTEKISEEKEKTELSTKFNTGTVFVNKGLKYIVKEADERDCKVEGLDNPESYTITRFLLDEFEKYGKIRVIEWN